MPHLLGDLLRPWARARARLRGRRSFSAVSDSIDVHREPDGPAVVGDGAPDGLPDPPRRIGRELEAAAELEAIDRLHQADVAFLNQVEQRQPAVESSASRSRPPDGGWLPSTRVWPRDDVLLFADRAKAPAETAPRHPRALLELLRRAVRSRRDAFPLVEAAIDVAQLHHDVVDDRRTDRLLPGRPRSGFERVISRM